jgi:tetratricopeptide (TPR) repeat protein
MTLLANEFAAEARHAFARAEALDPNEVRWPYFQGLILSWSDSEAAVEEFLRAVQLDQSGTDAVSLRLADLLLEQGRYEEAAQHYQSVVASHADDPRAQLGLGRIAMARGAWSESVGHFQVAAAHHLTARSARELQATAERHLGKPVAATKPSEGLEPAWHDPLVMELEDFRVGKRARLNRANQLLTAGKPAEAVVLLEPLLRQYPEADEGWLKLGVALLALKRYSVAEQALERVVELTPRSAEGQFYLGIAFLEQGQTTRATSALRRALEIKPANARAHLYLGRCLEQAGNRDAALAAYADAVRCKPDLAEAYLAQARTLMDAGRLPEARITIGRALQLQPDLEPAMRLRQRIDTQGK